MFREQPTSELAHTANESVRTALSPNERLQQLYHPFSTYAVVPLFALANAGIVVSSHFLAQAYASPVTLGILVAYVLGKPVGIASFTWLATRLSPGRVRRFVGWTIVDLAVPVDTERDHIRGPADAPVTLIEYGDFECVNCGQAEPVIRELLAGSSERPRGARPATRRRAVALKGRQGDRP